MSDETPLFTEEEWDKEVPLVVKAMQDYVSRYITAISIHHDDPDDEHGELWGTGSYIGLSDRGYILTNEHVARIRSSVRFLLHQPKDDENFYKIIGNHYDLSDPLDVAVLPVAESGWNATEHNSQLIKMDMISFSHYPATSEILILCGYSGERSGFHYDRLINRWTCSAAREVPLPNDSRFNERFHFGIDYRPDLATLTLPLELQPL